MNVYIPKPLVGLGFVALLGALWFFVYEELPALRRYIKFETM